MLGAPGIRHGHHPHGPSKAPRRYRALSCLIVSLTAVVVVVQLVHAYQLAQAQHRPWWRRKLNLVVPHSEYKARLQELVDHAEPHYVAFTSGVDENGISWCPDCQKVMPIIREVVLSSGGSLLEVLAGDRDAWHDRQHPIRIDANCPVQWIPTLYFWKPDGSGCGSSVANPLSSDELTEDLRLIVAKFVKETAAGKRRKLYKLTHHIEWKQHLPELLEHAEPHFILFTSGTDADGTPWCRDCYAASPVVREVVNAVGGSLLEVSSGERHEWKRDLPHPLKADKTCMVTYLPTLYYYTPEHGCDAILDRTLNSDETKESLRVLIAQFVKEVAPGKRYVDRVTAEVIATKGKTCGGC
ncbi:hypothetical protein HYH03_014829 [Edaphochlamys debaryana]|uniref:Thioredoxin domain-containing protein n=1 Tax=Edaphochlamys debaryana TaxID=47281 RepID=A0A835XLZ9_9CHLO|nr:hypothetical protein HYH03_014829 [Edaphochlamys debaryana]|eukprot:KAG2486528.1 hypothetical protein HYH03_014829 [Edaphochlamys debaryana]